MKLLSTTFKLTDTVQLTKDHEASSTMGEYISIHEAREPCSGIARRWYTRKALISELKEIIKALEE